MKKSFIIHIDSLGILDELTDEQAGQLFKEIYNYHNPKKPKETQITQVVKLAFYSFKSQFERDLQTYSNVVERNTNNGKLGGRPKNKNPEKPRKADSDSVSVSDSVNDNKKEKEIIIQDVIDYFASNNYTEEAAKKFFNFYKESNWFDTNNKKIKNWKQKAIGVWFKPENLKKEEPKKFTSFLKPEDNEW
mgnify:CR=1 FL=1